ncbi:MAG: hypothetical protein AMS27_13300 [Bacteroides sp. SM23_62_1]|nr:MAG: hypothetical protein AMS27_13300 [Bacteroides sp. SM23_62_1]
MPQYSTSQVYHRPNFAFSSHETLELERIEIDEDQTRLLLSILNRRLSGTFCVDTNTYIRNSLGDEEYKLIQSMGIPDCPDAYKFTAIGEKLEFILIFPPISEDLLYIDIIEECDEACFSLKYVLLDQEINEIINQGFNLYEAGNLTESLKVFEDLMTARNDNLSPVFGTIYLYMMTINYDLGRSKEVQNLLDELEKSSIINKDEIIEAARFEGLIR